MVINRIRFVGWSSCLPHDLPKTYLRYVIPRKWRWYKDICDSPKGDMPNYGSFDEENCEKLWVAIIIIITITITIIIIILVIIIQIAKPSVAAHLVIPFLLSSLELKKQPLSFAATLKNMASGKTASHKFVNLSQCLKGLNGNQQPNQANIMLTFLGYKLSIPYNHVCDDVTWSLYISLCGGFLK